MVNAITITIEYRFFVTIHKMMYRDIGEQITTDTTELGKSKMSLSFNFRPQWWSNQSGNVISVHT